MCLPFSQEETGNTNSKGQGLDGQTFLMLLWLALDSNLFRSNFHKFHKKAMEYEAMSGWVEITATLNAKNFVLIVAGK